MLSVIMLSVIMLNVMLNVVAPFITVDHLHPSLVFAVSGTYKLNSS
jgi:hypothetical protein